MSYRVLITPSARAKVVLQARYIAVDCHAPLNAQRWLNRVFDAADTLTQDPYRCAFAAERDFRAYDVRRLLVGDYLLLFRIAEADQTVWVIGFRHGRQLPDPAELPDAPP